MSKDSSNFSGGNFGSEPFKGTGLIHSGPWHRSEDGPVEGLDAEGHPAFYDADPDLVAAVNAAMLLGKPLLLTGNPGTGKSELAERVAWEFRLGPVLRFEAQSLSEATDLFYRYDLVGRMAEARISAENRGSSPRTDDLDPTHPAHFVEFGALGKAIFRMGANLVNDDSPDPSNPKKQQAFEFLRRKACGNHGQDSSRPSVVLIDEIDKASRDFPNDLLNAIDRMEFRIREVENLLVAARRSSAGAQAHQRLRPIVIITSNQERDLPPPFMRRCAFHHIDDPDQIRLAKIVRLRVFQDRDDLTDSHLPPFYRELVECFFKYRVDNARSQGYTVGTTELREMAWALRQMGVPDDARLADQRATVRKTLALVAKHRADVERWAQHLDTWHPAER